MPRFEVRVTVVHEGILDAADQHTAEYMAKDLLGSWQVPVVSTDVEAQEIR